ncbi:hypothetical protein K456DRAFT_56502 [Colletotrichum gloeosporioides 23]|nr:hypothetical protein K456DRAFT_56502 [Colletotrichum gloeosporioides 23]
MLTCSYCEGKGYNSCEVSSSDSSRCAEYVRLSCSRYDVLGKMWFEKMMRAVRCGINSVEELERVEREEAEAEQHWREEVRPPSASSNHLLMDFIRD